MMERFTREAWELWEKAVGKANSMGNQYVGPEHAILAFFDSDHSLSSLVLEESVGSYDSLYAKIQELHSNGTTNPQTSDDFLRKAQQVANLSFSSYIDLNHILFAALGSYKEDSNMAVLALQSFGVNIDRFLKNLKYSGNAKKEAGKKAVSGSFYTVGENEVGSWSVLKPLEKYGRDLTALAQRRGLDPMALREEEIEDIIEVLCRRVKSNPLLVGEPGVGKSALMTGLAQRIVVGQVPEKLRDVKIFELNMTSIIAGASLQGEFEKRMTNIINYVKQEKNIILFIDEIHSIVGAGGAPGLGDAANILKAPLVSGEIKCIGATTMKEYRRYIERDPALARRFQMVEIREPSPEQAAEIINSIKHLYEEYHNVILPEKVVRKTIDLAVLHIKDQYLPDKAIDLIDQACAHVALSRTDEAERTVTVRDIAQVLSHKTKIPLEKLTSDKLEKLLHLEEHLKARIIGQDEAIDKVGDIIRLTKSSLDLKPVRPDGVFLFIGPTGVGKTELARVLGEILFDDEAKLIRLDMSEYMEPHSVSKIIGSPPGYIGSDQEGGLTGKIRTEPYSIVLLDEVEKAHPDVLNIFLQVFEDGRLTDSHGRTVFFSNCTVIMTSNIGAAKAFAQNREIGFSERKEVTRQDDLRGSKRVLIEAVKRRFSPEFINRIDEIVYFKPLDRAAIKRIAYIKLREIRERFTCEHKEISIDDAVMELISQEGYNPEYGARFLNRVIEDMVLKPLSRQVLASPEARGFAVRLNEKSGIEITGRS